MSEEGEGGGEGGGGGGGGGGWMDVAFLTVTVPFLVC